jgi:hypothetical protein
VNAWCAIIESKANGKFPEICECAREIAGVDNVKAGDGNQAAQSSDPEIRTRAALDSESESEDGESKDEDDEDHSNRDNKGHDDQNSNADDHGDDGDIDSADDGDTHNNNRNSGTNDTSSTELSELSEPEADHSSEYDMDNREIEVKQEKVGAKVSRGRGRK